MSKKQKQVASVRPSSKLLIDESPLLVLPSLAVMVGLELAIILQQIHFLTASRRDDDRRDCLFDGRWWVKRSYAKWRELTFSFWPARSIRRYFQEGEDAKLLVSRVDPTGHDRSKWYAIDYVTLQALCDNSACVQIGHMAYGQIGQGGVSNLAASSLEEELKDQEGNMSGEASLAADHPTQTEVEPSTPPSTTADIQAAYVELLGYPLEKGDWSGGESKAAKKIAAVWTVEQFREAYTRIKDDKFWANKRLTLAYLSKQVHEVFRSANGDGAPNLDDAPPWIRGLVRAKMQAEQEEREQAERERDNP